MSVRAMGMNRPSLVEKLEGRRMLSVSTAGPAEPAAKHAATAALDVGTGYTAKLAHPVPGKILAGNDGMIELTIRNLSATSLSGSLDVALAASLDGTTSAASLPVGVFPPTITISAHHTARSVLPFTVPPNLAAGHYLVLGTVTFAGMTNNLTSAGKINVVVPPGPVTSPSLVGNYNGLIHESHTDGGFFGGGTTTHVENYTVHITGQTIDSLTASVDVGGTALIPGTYSGSETSAGKFDYTFTASGGYSLHMKGKVRSNGSILIGTITGTFPGALFSNINGNFKITRTT